MERAHPFMPNSTEEMRALLLEHLGAKSAEELFEQIPADHRHEGSLGLPPALSSEASLRRHLHDTLSRNVSCSDVLSFLGGGCWQHHVPAVCDEIVRRSEFLTPVWGTTSSDFGRNQAWLEFQSLLGELVDMDYVTLPVYSWGCAVGHALRMASRITGRRKVLIPAELSAERRGVIAAYCETSDTPSHLQMEEFPTGPDGRVDLASLERMIDSGTAAVYVENPSFTGLIETQLAAVAELVHRAGAEFIVGVDPLTLGVLQPPSTYGADIVVGSIQPLGIPMYAGGGLGGFMASRDEEKYARQYPTLQVSLARTVKGERAFPVSLLHQSSYGSREDGNDWTGNSTYLWAIGAAVYMSLMGPRGFEELGETILQRSHFAAGLIDAIPNVSVPRKSGFFKEFIVDFSEAKKTVAEINAALRQEGIFGGLDLGRHVPGMEGKALYCVTELHTEADLNKLADALGKVVS
jgi:glycine dehydrogenase subunit 1